MKSRFITFGIGTVVTAIALSQAMAAHQDATKPDASRVQPATAGQQVTDLEGKIMTLHAYLSGASSWGTDNAGSAATAPATSSQQPQRDRNQNTNTGDEHNRTRANATATDKAGSAERSATTANPADATRTDAGNPPWQGWAGKGAGTFSDQTLVFVAMRGTTVSSPSSTTSSSSTTTERNPNALPAISATPGSLATSAYGEAYVLLCNSNDPGSRSALSKAQSMAPGAAPSATDRVQVRGKEETASPSTVARSEDPARQPAPDRASDQGYKPYAPNYGHAVLDGKVVKVSGKILSRGGIQAIEVATIEDASTTSPTPSSSSSSDGTAIK